MNSMIINHPWIDETFYKSGSFIIINQGKDALLLKGGIRNSDERAPSTQCETIFCKDFFEDIFLFHHSEDHLTIALEDLRSYLGTSMEELGLSERSDDDKIFMEDFRDLKQQIPSNIKKAVLVSRQNYHSKNRYALIKHLFAKAIHMNQGRSYGFWQDNQGIIGCTPEVLFEINDGTLMTEALAGTAKKGQESYLTESIKDRNEHEFVIQDLCEKICSLNLTPKIESTQTSGFSSIIHLRTIISAKLIDKISALTLSRILSPTAALGGYPRKISKSFLLNTRYNRAYPQRVFGSVIGTEQSGPLGLVMIRNVQWDEQSFFVESGVGIVNASELSQEMEELKLKRKVVRDYYL